VIVHIASDRPSYPLDLVVLRVLIDPFLFSELLMEDHYLVEELVEVELVPVLDKGDWVLPIEVDNDVPGMAALPVNLDGQVVVSGVELHSDGSIPVTVDEIADVFVEVV